MKTNPPQHVTHIRVPISWEFNNLTSEGADELSIPSNSLKCFALKMDKIEDVQDFKDSITKISRMK